MSRKFVLPFLLGLKFNIATLLPLILGAIILISKKAAFLSKLALFISGFFGLGGLATIGGLGLGGGNGFGYYRPPLQDGIGGIGGFGGGYKTLESVTPRLQEELQDHFYEFDKKQLKDRSSRLYERDFDQEKHTKYRPTNQRSFAWASANQEH